jgi:hypothetical protein
VVISVRHKVAQDDGILQDLPAHPEKSSEVSSGSV